MSKILIVDDDYTARTAIESMLANEGYELFYAQDGKEALHAAQSIQPDLILLDVMMPSLDGFEVCRRLRASPELAEVPIILLTALDDSASLIKGIESGADDFLSKPVDRQELRARVRTITRLNRYRTLLSQRESLREMAQSVITTQEEERRRISRELHDDIGQALTAHKLTLHNLQADLPKEQVELQQRMDLIITETSDLISCVRQISQQLRPPMLDTLGFSTATNTYCTEFSRRSGMQVQYHIDPELGEIPDVHAITLYRVLQEALTNISRHSKAETVWVDISIEDNRLCLMVQDNGIGFNIENENKNGIGILSIRERLALVGGELDLRSRIGQGTILSAYVPYKKSPIETKELR